MELKNVTVVLGSQWGDEGKGKIVDMLADQADVVARCQVSSCLAILIWVVTRFMGFVNIAIFRAVIEKPKNNCLISFI